MHHKHDTRFSFYTNLQKWNHLLTGEWNGIPNIDFCVLLVIVHIWAGGRKQFTMQCLRIHIFVQLHVIVKESKTAIGN